MFVILHWLVYNEFEYLLYLHGLFFMEGKMERRYDDIENAMPYGRLSLEDRDKKNFSIESDSIVSQRNFILQFCNDKKIKHKSDGYYDDGITGLTFDRENWKKLLEEIEKGLVDCVITKDLSRLGRDHSETGYYVEKYFPERKIRFISINDNWDSKYDSVDMLLWKMAYNDVYCADISRKVKGGLNSRKREGMWLASFAPYGYKKDPEDKHHLIVDPDTAPIVKEIFAISYSGVGNCGIAKYLTEKNYPTPGEVCGRIAYKTRAIFEKSGHIWTTSHVRRILSHEVYIGVTAQCKIKKVSYKSKKTIRNDRADWIVVEDTHEPLVSKEVFDIVQKKLELTSRKYTRLPGEGCLLSKLLYCKECGHRISVTWKSPAHHDKGKCGTCNYYKKYSRYNVCTPHYIDYDELEDQILTFIKNVLKKRLDYFDTPKLIKENFKNIQNEIDSNKKRYDTINNNINKAEQLLLKMYEDNISGKINDMMYQTMSERKQNEINDLKRQQTDLDSRIKEFTYQLENSDSQMKKEKELINKFLNSKVISQDLINQLIEKILISENDNVDIIFTIKELNTIRA